MHFRWISFLSSFLEVITYWYAHWSKNSQLSFLNTFLALISGASVYKISSLSVINYSISSTGSFWSFIFLLYCCCYCFDLQLLSLLLLTGNVLRVHKIYNYSFFCIGSVYFISLSFNPPVNWWSNYSNSSLFNSLQVYLFERTYLKSSLPKFLYTFLC